MSALQRTGKNRPDATDEDASHDRFDPTPEAECRHCGRALDPAIARVVGDNDGCVDRCKQCTDGITRTSVAARAARGDGLRVASEGRMGGEQ